MVIGTDCTGGCKSNYHMIMMTPLTVSVPGQVILETCRHTKLDIYGLQKRVGTLNQIPMLYYVNKPKSSCHQKFQFTTGPSNNPLQKYQSNLLSNFCAISFNFMQSKCIIGPVNHVEFLIGRKNINLVNIPTKFTFNWSSGFGEC